MAVADKAMEQSQATSATQLAADPELALQNTKLHLLSSKPFYGFVLCSFPCETHSKVTDIAAVVAKGTTLTIHINPETFPRLPLSVRGKILEHEILHLLHRHLPVRPDVDPMLWNIAADLAINTLMKPNHPDYQDPEHPERSLLCLLPERVERSVGIKLPPSGDAELYYSLLLKDKERHGGAGVVIIISPDGKHKAIAREDDPRLGKGWKVYDLHPHFAKGLDPSNPEGGLSAPLPSPEMLDAEIRAIVEEAAKMAGSIPDSLKSVIKKLYKPKIDWRRILRRFAGSVISEATFRTWMKPNRRIPFLPGKRRELEASIVAIIDTSGSMSDQQLAAIGSELYQISKLTNSTVTVVEADAEVQRHYVLTAPTLKVKMKQGFQGRGGTAFRPAFEWAEARHPDGIIYFTDGYNYDEEWLENHRPPCPVLWVITHDGRIPAKWGWKVKLPEPRD